MKAIVDFQFLGASWEEEKVVSIEVKDWDFRILARIEMTPDDFARAIFWQLGNVPCEIKMFTEKPEDEEENNEDI